MNWNLMRMHLADPKLCDFSVPREFYEFHLLSPTPDLSPQSSVVSSPLHPVSVSPVPRSQTLD